MFDHYLTILQKIYDGPMVLRPWAGAVSIHEYNFLKLYFANFSGR